MKRHKWTEDDDKKAFYAYKFLNADDVKLMTDDLPMSINSFKMRIENFRYLDKGIGLPHFSEQSKKIYEKYKNASKEEFGLQDVIQL